MQRAGIVLMLCGEISGMGQECVGCRTWRKVVRLQGPESVSAGSECLEWHSLGRSRSQADKDKLTASIAQLTRPETGKCRQERSQIYPDILYTIEILYWENKHVIERTENWHFWPVTIVAEINICIISCSIVYFLGKIFWKKKSRSHKLFVNVKKNTLVTMDKCDILSSMLFKLVFNLSCPSNSRFASHQFTLNIFLHPSHFYPSDPSSR